MPRIVASPFRAGRVRQWLGAVQAAIIDGPRFAASRYEDYLATIKPGAIGNGRLGSENWSNRQRWQGCRRSRSRTAQ
jgi:hypothetical protein